MSIVVLWLLAALCVVLDIVALAALLAGLFTFVALDALKPLRWQLLGCGLVGLLIFLPAADFFLRKAVSVVLAR
jgi:hypothetical protein